MKKIVRLIKIIVSISAIAGLIAFVADRFGNSNSNHKPFGIYEKYIKRPLDCFLATGALIVLSPLLIIVALLVRLNFGSPVIFTQERPGKDEKIFKLYKFRTMTDEKDENGKLLPDEVRLTSFGKWLRSTSLDGNVIIGQTTESLVNKGFREVSPNHFLKGRDLFSQSYNGFHLGGVDMLVA